MFTGNTGGPAFPTGMSHGMNLRDYFAAQEQLNDFDAEDDISLATAEALAGKHPGVPKTPEERIVCLQWNATWRARLKYMRADAMIAARNLHYSGECTRG